MFEIIFLGTSASAPSTYRGLPSQIIKHNEHRFLLDCGEGTQRQILKSGLGFRKLNRLLITHGHLDHILGIGGLISTYLRWEAMNKLEIYGGQSALDRIHDLLFKVVIRGVKTPFPIDLIPITEGPIISENDMTIRAFPVNHRGPDCFGYIFEEKGKRPFQETKAKALHIPQGPWRRDLVNGKAAKLPDGRTIQPDEVLGDFQTGTKLVVVGDTGETESLIPYCEGADALVIEGTYLQNEIDMAHEFAHLTAHEAAILAERAHVEQLFLTHISRRYREKDVENEAREVFPSTHVARDFDHYTIKRN
ncbi:MAG: ribonuclease Z [Anaerolineaceae bacterium]|nr:ribonuclease Z [Anaerolineaceae bacterium]